MIILNIIYETNKSLTKNIIIFQKKFTIQIFSPKYDKKENKKKEILVSCVSLSLILLFISCKFFFRDTNLVWDIATQSGTGHKSGIRNVYQFSNDLKVTL